MCLSRFWRCVIALCAVIGACDPGQALTGAGSAPTTSATKSPSSAQSAADRLAATKTEVYEGNRLFDFLNGGAEVKLEYGVRQVEVETFEAPSVTPGDAAARVVCETWRCATPSGAFGLLFGPEIDGSEAPAAFGDRGFEFAGGREMIFQCGAAMISIRAEGSGPAPASLARTVAQAVAGRHPDRSELPEAVRQLPTAGRTGAPARLFLGPLAASEEIDESWFLIGGETPMALARYRAGREVSETREMTLCFQVLSDEELARARVSALQTGQSSDGAEKVGSVTAPWQAWRRKNGSLWLFGTLGVRFFCFMDVQDPAWAIEIAQG